MAKRDGAVGRKGGAPHGEGAARGLGAPVFELVVLALGFGLCRAWALVALSLSTRWELMGMGPFQYGQLYLLSGAVGALFVALGAVWPHWLRRVPGAFAGATVVGAVLSLACMALAWTMGGRAALVAAFALSGIASALLQILWGERFARHGMRLALLAMPLAAVVVAVVMLAVAPIAEPACFVALPLASLALWCVSRGDAGSVVLSLRMPRLATAVSPTPRSDARLSVSRGTLVRLMASIAVFSLVGRALDAFQVGADESASAFLANNHVYLAVALAGLLFIALVMLCGERFDVLFVYRLSLPCMVAGFTVLTLFADRFTLASVGVVTVGYEFFEILFWALLVGIVRQTGRRPLVVFGWGIAATYAGMAAGTALSLLLVDLIAAGRIEISAFSLGGILVLVVLVALVLPEGILLRASLSRAAPKVVRLDDEAFELRCRAAAAAHGLTPRELDVLRLVARGRTLAVVTRELHIAEGTARTHMGRIYVKLGVHRQQELIDLIEGMPVPAEA